MRLFLNKIRIKMVIIGGLLFIATAFITQYSIFFKVPLGWPKPVYNFTKNPLTKPKIELGRRLFYDPILSRNNTVSCASCHSQYSAFTHVDHALSHGIDDKIGTRNAPALINLAWHKTFMRDGAINHLDMQALAPISNPLEMDENIKHLVLKLQNHSEYPQYFYKAFGDSIITGEHFLKAISQFMLVLVSNHSRYDSMILKKIRFTKQENLGYLVFKKNCEVCHKEPLFTNDQFMDNGLNLDILLNDFGRYGVTKNPLDSFKFKVPTLRNIEFTAPYMHDGRFKNLREVTAHYTSKIDQRSTIALELKNPILLSDNDKVDLMYFLLTLSDKVFLFNPNYSFPKKY